MLRTALLMLSLHSISWLATRLGTNELAASAREIIESYEYEGNPLKIVENVYSHNILPWKIHGDKFIKPDYVNYNENLKVEAGEQYAIEFYTSNGLGKGKLIDAPHTYSHYRLQYTQHLLIGVRGHMLKTMHFWTFSTKIE